MGPGDLGRRPPEHLLRLLPRGLRPRSLRDLDRADGRRRHGDRQGRDAVPLRPPAAAGRVDAAQQPRERQARTRLVRRAARRDGVSAADGGPAAPHRSRSLRATHQAGRELRRRARPVVRGRALGGAERLLAVDDRRGDRRAHRGRRPRRCEQRPRLGRDLARHCRRLPALDQELDGDDERPVRAALLHPPLEDGRPERRDHVQRRQRRADARPASGDRPGLPRAHAARGAAGERPGHPRLAPGRRRADPQHDGCGRRLPPLQRRRLRRPIERRPALGAVRPGQRPPLARPVGRARGAAAADRRHRRRRVVPRQHGRDGERRRAHPRAELGEPRPRTLGVRLRSDHGVDRVRERRRGRLGCAARLVGRRVRPARPRPCDRDARRPSCRDVLALRPAHAGHDDAHRDAAGRPVRRRRVARHGDGYLRGRQHRVRGCHEYRQHVRDHHRDDHRCG